MQLQVDYVCELYFLVYNASTVSKWMVTVEYCSRIPLKYLHCAFFTKVASFVALVFVNLYAVSSTQCVLSVDAFAMIIFYFFPADLTDVEDGNAAALTDGVDANVDDTPKVGD